MQVQDVFEQFGQLFADFFNHNPDIGHTLELTDEEAAAGVTRTIDFDRRIPCDACDGRGSPDPAASTSCTACKGTRGRTIQQGFLMFSEPCKTCHGAGRIVKDACTACAGSGGRSEHASVTVEIPAGVQHEQTIRVPGAGSRKADGTVGSLFVYVLVGGRPDSRLAAFAQPIEPELPAARIHNAKRPLPWVQIAWIGVLLALLAALVALKAS